MNGLIQPYLFKERLLKCEPIDLQDQVGRFVADLRERHLDYCYYHHLQLQLDQFHTYTALKGLTLNVQKNQNHGLLLLQPTSVSLQWHSA